MSKTTTPETVTLAVMIIIKCAKDRWTGQAFKTFKAHCPDIRAQK